MAHHSILQKEVLSNSLPRNSFDLSHRHLFTADVGELLPIFCEHTNPNEHFSINPTVFLRAQTLNTAAFTRMKQNIDFFFIPYRLLSSYLDQVLVSTDYNTSSLFPDSVKDSQFLPLLYAGSKTPANSSEFPVNCFDNVTASNSNPLIGKKDIFGFAQSTKSARLMELLGYGRLSDTSHSNEAKHQYGLSALNIYAYNKVYFDFFRNPLLETYNAKLCNFDNLYSSSVVDLFDNMHFLATDRAAELGMFNLRYHNYKNDYFTHQFTDFRVADFLNTNLSAPLFPVPNSTLTNESRSQGSVFIDSQVNLSVSNLRSAYALDKLLALSQQAKDGSYEEQIKAHFGFDPNLDSQKVRFIGSVDAPVTISDVEGTATTSQSTIGQIVGKGVSMTNGTFEFDSNEHGIIMGIFYILPEADYSSRMTLNPFNLKVLPSNYFKPEFQDLGLQPCTQLEVLGPEASTFDNPTHNSIFGYTNRYSEYKSRVDKISGEFNEDLNAWVTPRDYSGFVRKQHGLSLSLAFSKVNPSSVNNIFAVEADGVHNQFMCAAQFNVTAIRPMSIFGSPYSNI